MTITKQHASDVKIDDKIKLRSRGITYTVTKVAPAFVSGEPEPDSIDFELVFATPGQKIEASWSCPPGSSVWVVS